jgi:parallel beta-helix repeat protein
MTRNVVCARRLLIALAVALIFSGSDGSSVAGAQSSPASGTYYVSPDGSDAAAGTQEAPFRTIQKAASLVDAGDTVVVRAGTYAGFQLGWDFPQNGTAAQPITFEADPGVVIESRNSETLDGINLEGSSFVVIDGFAVDNASGNIDRACIRTVSGRNVTVRDNDVSNCGTWGIFTSHSDYVRIEGNKTSSNNSEDTNNHGIYVSNATVDPVIVGNEIRDNRGAGLHMNGDLSQGGNGLITGARIESNVVSGNGEKGGSGINCDGVQDSLIRNNLLYGNHASGISLYRVDAAEGAKNNVVVNNTIRMASDGRWAVNIKGRSTGNTVSNNVLLHDGQRGAINIVRDSLSGFVSDHNAVKDRFSTNDGESFLTLAQWRDATQQDGSSFVSDLAALFVDANDYHLSAASPAIDAGSPLGAPNVDIEGHGRPVGSAHDIGAYEFGSASPPAVDTTPPEISDVRVSNVKRRSVSVTWMTDEASTTTVHYGRTTAYGKERSSDGLVVRHVISVTGLSANTRYHFQVESTDEAGNPAASADLTFRTARR